MERITEIQARLAEINAELDNATGDALTALETESRTLLDELNRIQTEVQARQQLRASIAAGAGTPVPNGTPAAEPSVEERAAANFVKTNRMTIGADQARATLISSGQLIKPTKVNTEIQDIPGTKVSSIIDLVHIEDCVGMSSYQVPYVVADADAAGEQVEGAAGSVSELAQFDYVTINPTNVLVLGQISKQAKKQTNVKYAAKVQQNALLALRKKAAAIVTGALKASELVKEIPVTAGKIDATTLRNLTLQYGGDESVLGNAYLTFPGELVAEVPTPYYRATPAQLRSLLDYIYPVGSIYMSYSHVDPADLFGGTWVRIENAFLWGVDEDGAIGLTGGSKTHTLTVNELPSHSHGSVYSQHANGTKDKAWYTTDGTSVAYGTVATGGGAAHNNMPPYVQVSIWRRTA